MIVAVPKETFPGERRVALVPSVVAVLTKAGLHIKVQAGAGEAAGFRDQDYAGQGAEILATREEIFACESRGVLFADLDKGAHLPIPDRRPDFAGRVAGKRLPDPGRN